MTLNLGTRSLRSLDTLFSPPTLKCLSLRFTEVKFLLLSPRLSLDHPKGPRIVITHVSQGFKPNSIGYKNRDTIFGVKFTFFSMSKD